ncbi:hypothetical protein CROQUDRAFT_95736 [Cronartium quercuum f. sp. fusiforme G11]|uniref:DNA2/NAM7 helicase helicase domain-containing protein n=1 Tax=Cronartium quercuum f. sp. fusiforme G11 TaxID=708437 RepID=A0A9P6NDD0_9BASI|nr:hypothetical protein CROQUDRAFT_95736 [Cronartium quercuum f. sp. fusiforme G11]
MTLKGRRTGTKIRFGHSGLNCPNLVWMTHFSKKCSTNALSAVALGCNRQLLATACWILISKSKHKVILAGDPCQLPPTIKSIKHASTSQTKAKKKTPGKTLPKVKEIVEDKKGNLVAGKPFKAKDDDSKSKETKSIDAEKTEGDSKDNRTEIQPNQSTSDGESEDKSDSDNSQTEKETESFEKFTAPSGLGRKPSPPAKWNGPQFFKMKPPKSLEVTMFDRLLKSNSSISCLLDVRYVSDWEKPATEKLPKISSGEMLLLRCLQPPAKVGSPKSS